MSWILKKESVIGCFQKRWEQKRLSSSSWETMKKRAGIENLQLKDFRNWFNHHLKHELQFTTKEAASYLGHCPKVNETHYEPISKERMTLKLNSQSLAATNLLQSLRNNSRYDS